ncbi:choline ethanolamine kinase [Stylonychia lemnae]|uniref:Choline ethanolamine kinase n=1 Tax=Stylonychia lemnae TaxID=5949 RepID=A0A078B8I5_STYLE|nr:choline ethanolamine kinase [Stylonychia lemnae]|eukprot:CDW90830.1 choline ethanolamine kinase [Stylonychia lemnae]
MVEDQQLQKQNIKEILNHKEDLRLLILKNIQEHIPSWRNIITHEMVHLTRLSGLSNACYRVKISPEVDDDNFQVEMQGLEPQSLLYRVFECPIVDWDMENVLFKTLSDQGIGPKLYYQCAEYRIEGFFLSRPITIFEMRNTLFLDAFAEKICDFNYNKEAQESVNKFISMDQIQFRIWMSQWVDDVKKRLIVLREKQANNPDILRILQEFEEQFFFEGHIDYFESHLCSDSEIVLAHNDTQENNILSSLEDSTQILLIDFEYIGWAPRAYDLANYIAETMLENAYPLKNGIKCYLKNFMNDQEQKYLITKYLERHYEKYFQGDKTQVSLEDYLREEVPKLLQETRHLMLIANYMWAVWSLKILKDENEGSDKCFNFDYLDCKIQMFKLVKQLYNF